MQLKIKDIFNIEKGNLQSSKAINGKYNFITASSKWKTNNYYTHDTEAIIIAVAASGSLGRTHYVHGKFISSDLCFILTPKQKDKPLNLTFYYYYFRFIKDDLVQKTATGTSKKAINKTSFGNYTVPYFNIDRQYHYEKLLLSLQDSFDNLFENVETQTNLIQQLRQAILQEAIQGKLLPQDPNDEPASILLEQIKAEKAALIKVKKINKEKPLPPITEEEIPFDLPEGWVWCRLGEVINLEMGQSPPGDTYNTEEIGLPLINGPVEFTKGYFGKTIITKWTSKPTKICDKGDFLICVRGSTTGRTNIADFKACIGRGVAAIKPLVYKKFVHYFVIHSKKTVFNLGKGSTFPNVSKDKIREITLGLPPLSEQNRIVEKVEDLLSMCDELQEQVEQSAEDAGILMQAVLQEAFES